MHVCVFHIANIKHTYDDELTTARTSSSKTVAIMEISPVRVTITMAVFLKKKQANNCIHHIHAALSVREQLFFYRLYGRVMYVV